MINAGDAMIENDQQHQKNRSTVEQKTLELNTI